MSGIVAYFNDSLVDWEIYVLNRMLRFSAEGKKKKLIITLKGKTHKTNTRSKYFQRQRLRKWNIVAVFMFNSFRILYYERRSKFNT